MVDLRGSFSFYISSVFSLLLTLGFWLTVFAGTMALTAATKGAAHVTLTFTVSTNYYLVQGRTFPEIRSSVEQSRPWKTNQNKFDGWTEWRINWDYHQAGANGEVRLTDVKVTGTAKISVPKLQYAPTLDPDTLRRWQQYSDDLLRHELGHAGIARAATEAVKRQFENFGSYATRRELSTAVENAMDGILKQFKQKETDYDWKTNHGRNG